MRPRIGGGGIFEEKVGGESLADDHRKNLGSGVGGKSRDLMVGRLKNKVGGESKMKNIQKIRQCPKPRE